MEGTLEKVAPVVLGAGGYADLIISGNTYRLNPYTPAYIDRSGDWAYFKSIGLIPESFNGYIEDFVTFEGYSVEYDLLPDGTLAWVSVVSASKPKGFPWGKVAVAGGLSLTLLVILGLARTWGTVEGAIKRGTWELG